ALREQAAEEHRLMKISFSQSDNYRVLGHRTKAHELFQKGKMHQRTMEELNIVASEMIFLGVFDSIDRKPYEIDLHGLVVKEAELKVTEGIMLCEQRGDPAIRFIVGQGIHSDGGAAKLRPAIQQHIQEVLDHPVYTDPGNAGVLVVPL
ncbi:hypothetical protein B0H10DRAFT_1813856, partial [Mycena sp. CBHHK59/15]